MLSMPLPTLDRVRRLLDYDPSTGAFRWRVQVSSVRAGDWAGCFTDQGYISIGIDGHLILAHRLAWFVTHGQWPAGMLRLIDGNKSNCRIGNIEQSTHDQVAIASARNRNSHHRPNNTGHVGVSRKASGRYQARISVHSRKRTLGTFVTAREAAAAYAIARTSYDGKNSPI